MANGWYVSACETDRRTIWKMEMYCEALRRMIGGSELPCSHCQIDTQWGLRDTYQTAANKQRRADWQAQCP